MKDIADSRNSLTSRIVDSLEDVKKEVELLRGTTYVVFIRIESFAVKALFAFGACFPTMHTYPHITVQSECHVDPARQREEVTFQAPYESGWHGDQLPVTKLHL